MNFALLEAVDEDGQVDLLHLPASTAPDAGRQQQHGAPARAANSKFLQQRPSLSKAGGAPAPRARPSSTSSAAAGARSAAQPSRQARGRAEDYYRAFENVYRDASTGDSLLQFHKTNIVRVRPNGDVQLTTGGWFTMTTLCAMNDALRAMGMSLSYRGPVGAGAWAVTTDSGCQVPFGDGMVIPATQPAHNARAKALLKAWAGGAEVPAYAARGAVGPGAAQQQQQQQQQQPSGWGATSRPAATTQPSAAPAPPSTNFAAEHLLGQRGGGGGSGGGGGDSVREQLAALALDDGLDDEHLCVVCMEHQRDEVLVPCGHMVLCRHCLASILEDRSTKNECPMCREEIADHCTLDPHRA